MWSTLKPNQKIKLKKYFDWTRKGPGKYSKLQNIQQIEEEKTEINYTFEKFTKILLHMKLQEEGKEPKKREMIEKGEKMKRPL